MKVAEIRMGTDAVDDSGVPIMTVYYRNAPIYAIYRTAERVMIQFADDPKVQSDQRTAIAPLNPLRGVINGLIGSWRQSLNDDERLSAERFDRRVADALSLALEHDVANASLYLDGIQRDIDDERNSRARRYYLIAASVTAIMLFAVMAGINLAPQLFGRHLIQDLSSLLLASGAGAMGAFFSVAISIRNRSPLSDLRLWDNSIDAVLRVLIGVIGGAVLFCLFRTGIVSSLAFGENGAMLDTADHGRAWMMVAVIGFVAGFLERLVGDLLATAVIGGRDTAAMRPPVPNTRPDDSAGGAPAPARTDARTAEAPAAAPVPSPSPSDTDDAEGHVDGCDAPFDAADATDDEALPPASGGVDPAPPPAPLADPAPAPQPAPVPAPQA